MVEGKRSNRRWVPSSALKYKGLLWLPRRAAKRFSNRFHHPTQAYSDSLRPTPAKGCAKAERWLEAGIVWSGVEHRKSRST
jgi:hypothetical protein